MVVTPGKTIELPEEPTVPTPLSMVIDVAFDTLQLKVDELPAVMLVGLAVKKLTTGVPAADGVDGTDGAPPTMT